MPNNFINVIEPLVVNDTNVYIASGSLKSVIVFNTYLSNVSQNPTTFTLKIWDSSTASTKTLGLNLPLPVNSVLDFGKIVMKPTDKLIASAGTSSAVNFTGNILEIS